MFAVSGVILGEGRLIEVVASKAGRGSEVEWSVAASSLSRVRTVSIEDSADPWEGRLGTKWPDVVCVRFALDGRQEVTLSPPGPSEDRAALPAVARHLLDALGPTGGLTV